MPCHTHSSQPAPRPRTAFLRRWGALGPVLLLCTGVVASAQSRSPFATKKTVPAWEQPQAPAQTPAPAPVQPPAVGQPYVPPAPAPAAQPYTPPRRTAPPATQPLPATDWSRFQPSAAPTAPTAPAANTLPPGYTTQAPTRFPVQGSARQPAQPHSAQPHSGDWTHGRVQTGPAQPQSGTWPQTPPRGRSQAWTPPAKQPATSAYPVPNAAPGQSYYPPNTQAPYPTQVPYPAQKPYPAPTQGPLAPPPPQGWADRLGLRNLVATLRGGLRGGAAARQTDSPDPALDTDWEEAFVGDADAELEVSAITQGGLEYGVNLQARAQYDPGRRGFTRRLPDCPPGLAGCASVEVNGVPVALRGHTSQFYTSGPDVAEDTQIALESAHLFLRSAYGDITVGRDDGAAFLFSLGAPTLLNVGASNTPVDYTGLDAVKTVNDASGFAEKVTYTTPRLLGDQIGVGVQLGVSYAPDPNVCGVDYCVERGGITNVLTPDLEDVMEAGLALDRTFRNGLSVEGTLTYARATEVSDIAGLDDLQSLGAGVEVSLRDWTVGGSWLNSNQGVDGGDYEAFDVGLTWQPSALGFTLGYGRATDDLVNLSADQFTGGITYDWRDNVRLGAGVQYNERTTRRDIAGVAADGTDKGTAVFIEGAITF